MKSGSMSIAPSPLLCIVTLTSCSLVDKDRLNFIYLPAVDKAGMISQKEKKNTSTYKIFPPHAYVCKWNKFLIFL
jgi:hypothetical protein